MVESDTEVVVDSDDRLVLAKALFALLSVSTKPLTEEPWPRPREFGLHPADEDVVCESAQLLQFNEFMVK